ncbi:transposase family protein [Lacticaseibacillus sp. GG6-2]
MATVELNRYTVVNDQNEFLEADNLLLLPVWTQDIRKMWLTASQLEAQKVANQVHATACRLQVTALADNPAATKHRGIPVAVQQQIVSLRAQNMSYRQIAALLHISKSTVGNILNR